MENMSWLSSLSQLPATLLYQFPLLQQATDILLKSIMLLSVFTVLDALAGQRMSNTSRHLLWLYGFSSLVLLPLTPAVFLLLQNGTGGHDLPGGLFELPVYATQAQADAGFNGGVLLLVVYLLPVAVMLGRLLPAIRSLRHVCRHASAVTDASQLSLLDTCRQRLGISRHVMLCRSDNIESPVSFGLFKPQIMLPVQSGKWNEALMTDVLLHELCHIKRLDWLTTLSAYGLACLFWANPLVWLGLRRLRQESENSCDTAVLHAGRSDIDYAESLLGVVSSCIHARRYQRKSNPLVQTMLEQNSIKNRISRVLEENKMQASELKKELKKTITLLLLLSAGMLGVLGTTQVLIAQGQADPATRVIDEEMIPVHTEEPVYPRVAADGGIEGWVQVRFTVSAEGSVAEDSIGIVDAEPADIFNNSAIAATRKFRFSPRIVAGQPVAVPNVQYVFRYQLQLPDEPESTLQQ